MVFEQLLIHRNDGNDGENDIDDNGNDIDDNGNTIPIIIRW